MLAVDIEAYDPHLKDLGDGSFRKDGFVVCVGIYDGSQYYYFINTATDGTTYKWNDNRIYDMLKSNEPKVFHNFIYDMSWLTFGCGFEVNGTIHDTMTRAGLIDEYMGLGLDECCKYFNIQGKNNQDTIEAWFDTLNMKGTIWSNLKELWPSEVTQAVMKKYNEQDCRATYNLFYAQEKHMSKLQEAYDRECRLVPVLLLMRKNGVKIDTVERDRLTDEIKRKKAECETQLKYVYEITPDVIRSPKKMTTAMHNIGIVSPIKTASGGESWSADALELIDHPAIHLIQGVKNYDALLTKYLENSLVKCICPDGRIHGTFYPVKRDDGGTVTGRFSSSNPNLQNIPARESKHGQPSYGNEMRSLFIPDDDCTMLAIDYAQEEYMVFTHYSVGPQSEWLKEQARAGVDFHTIAQNITDIHIRKVVKNINFGIMYGMGAVTMYAKNVMMFNALAKEHGYASGFEYVQAVYNTYIEKFPVVKETMKYIQNLAQAQGYITTIGGRILHKPRPVFENGKWNTKLYKMLNKLIQGSSADILKAALVESYEAGVFDKIKLHLTVHDENVVSVPNNREGIQAAMEFQRIMSENSLASKLCIPLRSDGGAGPNWGSKEDSSVWENMKNTVIAC